MKNPDSVGISLYRVRDSLPDCVTQAGNPYHHQGAFATMLYPEVVFKYYNN